MLPRVTPSRLGTTKAPRVTNRRDGDVDVIDEKTRRMEYESKRSLVDSRRLRRNHELNARGAREEE